jgi:hypothetical protein
LIETLGSVCHDDIFCFTVSTMKLHARRIRVKCGSVGVGVMPLLQCALEVIQ